MKIAVIGSGKIGSTAAGLFLEANNNVVIANRRGPGSLAALVAELGPRAGGSQTSCATPNTAHSFTARDPEGNLWTFGTYRGAP